MIIKTEAILHDFNKLVKDVDVFTENHMYIAIRLITICRNELDKMNRKILRAKFSAQTSMAILINSILMEVCANTV